MIDSLHIDKNTADISGMTSYLKSVFPLLEEQIEHSSSRIFCTGQETRKLYT